MKRIVLAAASLFAACTWSNSLYQARVLTRDAQRAERERQPGQAQLLWGQVITKAESAYARAPLGKHGAEALWLEGHAASRTNDCARAVPALQGALSAAAHSPWEEQLLLELGTCEEALGGSTAVSIYATLLARTTDPAIKRQARMRQGHVLVVQGEWTRALAALEGEDSLPARLDRATALAQLGRTDEALRELSIPLAGSDTSVAWGGYLDILAVHNSAATDALLDRVLAFPSFAPARRNTLVLRTAEAAMVFDPAAAERRLQRIASSPGAVTARPLLQQIRLTRPTTPAELRGPVDSIATGELIDAGSGARRVAELVRFARLLLAKNDSTAPGAPRGDLTMFALGELARDSLGARRLSSWYFIRLEREWPQSPYVAKALIARARLEPDSADMLTLRLRGLTGNPYVAAATGDLAGRTRVPRLDDSLSNFIARLWATGPLTAQATDRP